MPNNATPREIAGAGEPPATNDEAALREYYAHGTPTPWTIAPSSNPSNGTKWRDIHSTGGAFSPAYVGEALEEDAAFIVAAVNSHDALLAALNNGANVLRLAIANGAFDADTSDEIDSKDGARSVLDEMEAAIAQAAQAEGGK